MREVEPEEEIPYNALDSCIFLVLIYICIFISILNLSSLSTAQYKCVLLFHL